VYYYLSVSQSLLLCKRLFTDFLKFIISPTHSLSLSLSPYRRVVCPQVNQTTPIFFAHICTEISLTVSLIIKSHTCYSNLTCFIQLFHAQTHTSITAAERLIVSTFQNTPDFVTGSSQTTSSNDNSSENNFRLTCKHTPAASVEVPGRRPSNYNVIGSPLSSAPFASISLAE
jgi:hypothetical protein